MSDEQTIERQDDYPPSVYSWYVVSILTLTYTVSFIDRQIMALMIDPMRHDLNISDTQVSLLIGLAFAVFYTLLGIPIARLADRYSRRKIIAAGIVAWCVMTAACGLVRTYAQLFLVRVGVGVGEAALSPSALSMISDYFPKRTRVRAIGVYNMGISLGAGMAMILGGQIVAHVMQAPPMRLPVVGQLFAWQTVFLLVGLPGLVTAILMMTVHEPRRREGLLATKGANPNLAFSAVIRYLGTRWRMYASHFIGMSTVAILAYGQFAWIPTMFIRTWGWTIGEVGLAYGCVVLVAGPLSAFGSAWLTELLIKKGYQDAQMRAALWYIGMGAIGSIGAGLAPAPWLSIAMLLPASVGTIAATACGLTGLMMATPNQMRAQASAMYYLVVNVFGLTAGPTGIALFTDYVFRNTHALRYSVASVSVLAGLLGVIVLFYNLHQYRHALAESSAWEGDRKQL